MKQFFAKLGLWVLIVAAILVAAYGGIGYFLSPQDKLEKADAIVVVSGGRTTARADEGIQLYKQGYAPTIIFSGAALDDGPSNAFAMRDQAVEAGVPIRDIFLEEDSQNTYQNATNVKPMLQDIGASKIILVTSPYHQRRADMTFRHVLGPDFKVIGVSSVDDRWSKSQWWQSGFPLTISINELYKIVFIQLSGKYQ